ncbi:hypothetical protein M432DRAFT_590238 [Thermoascus aurantiacus ATCC 26904]
MSLVFYVRLTISLNLRPRKARTAEPAQDVRPEKHKYHLIARPETWLSRASSTRRLRRVIATSSFDGSQCVPSPEPDPSDGCDCKKDDPKKKKDMPCPSEKRCPSPSGDHLGLRYGHCYRFTNKKKGQALSRRRGGNDLDLPLQGLQEHHRLQQGRGLATSRPRTTSVRRIQQPDSSQQGSKRPHGIQDQPGRRSDLQGLPAVPGQRLWHLCLASGDNGWPGLGEICPAQTPGIGQYVNPNYCLPVTVEEVPCLEELLGLRSAAGGRKKTVLSKAPERWLAVCLSVGVCRVENM